MPGFEFRYRIGGGRPTVRGFRVSARALRRGDMVNHDNGAAALAATGDTSLVGAAVDVLDGDARAAVARAVVDADAVYGVEDPNARTAGTSLDIAGDSGAQGVVDGVNEDLYVVASSGAHAETLVRIGDGRHRAGAAAAADEEAHGRLTGGELNAGVARAVVRFYREHTGRGPTRAQAFYRGNVVVVIMHDALTKAEADLVAQGKGETVLEFRRAFQDTMREELVAIVEGLTGCRVQAFMSTNHVAPDMAAEIFVLDRPVPGEAGAPDSADAAP